MKKRSDPALEYMLELNITPAKSPAAAREALRKLDVLEMLTEGMTKAGEDPQAWYRVKNSDPEKAHAIAGVFDGDVIRRCCERMDVLKDMFGSRILECGCDSGILSCYLAKRHPDAKVTGTDLCSEGLAAAEKLSEKLGLSNTEFTKETASLAGRFDTVVSVRTMHENCDVPEDGSLLPAEYEKKAADALAGYVAFLAGCLKDGGALVLCEREGASEVLWPAGCAVHSDGLPEDGSFPLEDAYLCAILLACRKAGLTAVPGSYKRIRCNESGSETGLHSFVLQK